jgi:hypothetical protein
LKFKKLFIIDCLEVGMSEKMFLIPFVYLHRFFNNWNLLNGEFNPAKLNYVSALHYIVDLFVIMFKTKFIIG